MTKVRMIFSAITMVGTVLVTSLVLGAGNLTLAFGDVGKAKEAEAADEAAPEVPSQEDLLVQQQTETEDYLTGLQANEAEVGAEIEAANQRIEALNATLAELETQVQASDAEVADYEAQINYANYAINGLYGEINQMQARESQFIDAVNQANQNVAELQAYVDQYNAALAQYDLCRER